jgi:hypothetical protein
VLRCRRLRRASLLHRYIASCAPAATSWRAWRNAHDSCCSWATSPTLNRRPRLPTCSMDVFSRDWTHLHCVQPARAIPSLLLLCRGHPYPRATVRCPETGSTEIANHCPGCKFPSAPREGLVQQSSTHVASASASSSFSVRAICAQRSANPRLPGSLSPRAQPPRPGQPAHLDARQPQPARTDRLSGAPWRAPALLRAQGGLKRPIEFSHITRSFHSDVRVYVTSCPRATSPRTSGSAGLTCPVPFTL